MAVFSQENLIVVYRDGDGESYSYALRYKNLYNLDEDQIVAVPCSNIEILADYGEFQTQIEFPLKTAISTGTLADRNVYGFVLMPMVTGGFYDGDDIVSSTSRISCMNQTYSRMKGNSLYNRQLFKRFEISNTDTHYICTRIDAPSNLLDRWFNNIENAKIRNIITGTIYIDPYSAYTFAGASTYTAELESFSANYANKLGIKKLTTKVFRAGKDAFFADLTDDCIFWGWGAESGSSYYFKRSDNMRAFFYNADLAGAFELRLTSSRKWPVLAIKENYCALASSLRAKDATEFLRPQPFWDALYRGATLGEAFLYAQPLQDCSICCLGDPLGTFQFQTPFVAFSKYTLKKSFELSEEFYAKAIVNNFRRSRKIDTLFNIVASGSDAQVQLDILMPIYNYRARHGDESYASYFSILTELFFNYAQYNNSKSYEVIHTNINSYLTYNTLKISDIIFNTSNQASIRNQVSQVNVFPIGEWIHIDVIEHYYGDFRFYNFELQIARSLESFDYGEYIFTASTFVSNENWYYENIDGEFVKLESNGLSSSYEGMKIKYQPSQSQYLNRGEYYWVRFRQVDELQAFAWRYTQILIYH